MQNKKTGLLVQNAGGKCSGSTKISSSILDYLCTRHGVLVVSIVLLQVLGYPQASKCKFLQAPALTPPWAMTLHLCNPLTVCPVPPSHQMLDPQPEPEKSSQILDSHRLTIPTQGRNGIMIFFFLGYVRYLYGGREWTQGSSLPSAWPWWSGAGIAGLQFYFQAPAMHSWQLLENGNGEGRQGWA